MCQHATLADGWLLWRDFAVRSAGFPVAGLGVFGSPDEQEGLRAIARDPLFREAVTWQNPAVTPEVAKVASGAVSKPPGRMRKREELVASYWQRYCAKTDMIGFFGPLAWGRLADAGPPLLARSGALVAERVVRLEAWAVQALAAKIDPDLAIATGQHAESDLRRTLTEHDDSEVRRRGLAALDRLAGARDAVAGAGPQELRGALGELDATFVELTGSEPTRNAGRTYAGRTLCYLDCMRDLDVTVGPALLAAIAPGLQTVLEASRWLCGQVHEIGRNAVEPLLPEGGSGPLLPVLHQGLVRLMQSAPQFAEAMHELQRRLRRLLADPEPATASGRAVAAFADHRPAWPSAVFQSVDVQVAARDLGAVARGDFLAVLGDVHPGVNPLTQGSFADRHPDPAAFLKLRADDLGGGVPLLLPPVFPGGSADTRTFPITGVDDVHIAALPHVRAPAGRRTWLAGELRTEGMEVVDAGGTLRFPLMDIFAAPLFIAAAARFELQPPEDHSPRMTIGPTVLARESWTVPAAGVPKQAADVAAFARDRGMPRRVFIKSPLETKPMYVDVESPALTRILCRQARHAEAADPAHAIRFTEMLPAPEECWLADPDGNRYVSELRLVAVDEARRGGCR